MSRLISLFIRLFIGLLAVSVLAIIFILPAQHRQNAIDNAPSYAIKIFDNGNEKKEAFIYVGMTSEQLDRAYRAVGYSGYSSKYKMRNKKLTIKAYSDKDGIIRHLISCDRVVTRMPDLRMPDYGLGLTNEVKSGLNRRTEYHDIDTGEIVMVERSNGKVVQRDYIEAGKTAGISDTLSCK